MSGFLCSMVGASFTVTATVNVLRGANTITANGNAQVSTAQSQFGGASALFDGNGDYLNIPTDTTFNFGTGDFTLEAWVRRTSQSGDTFILSASGSGGLFWGFRNGTEMGWGQVAIVWDYNVAAGLSTNTWYHVALTRSGTSMRMFVNGSQIGSTQTNSTSYNLSTTSFNIGSQGANYYYDGYIDEVRVSNTARYTANFTAPAVAFVNDANTVFLMHANGTNASTTFTDDNGARTQNGITANGNAQVSTAQSKFGGASALFDGTSDYLLVADNSNFTFGANDFTIEFWVRPSATANTIILWDQRPNGSQGLQPTIYINNGTIYYYTNVANRITGSTLSNNTWYHVAVSRSATSTKMFIDGTQVGSTYTDSNNYVSSSAGITIGADQYSTGSNSLNGYMDEIRVSNSARYTTTFTPSTTAFVNDANTVLLMHADGTNASTVFTDDNSILNVTSAATSVDEGSSLTFNVATQNLANQTLYYSLSNSGDFATSTGSFSLTSNAGSFSVTPTADTTTEGAETFTASVRIGSTSGTVIATSSSVTINDTSVAAGAVGQAAVSSVINYSYNDYSQSRMAYVGPDSSNRPVFLFAYANSSNNLKAQLFRINDDGTITQGSEQGPGSNQSCSRTVKCMSEYEGANSFGNGSPTNYAYLTYADGPGGSNYKVQVVLADPSALTCTFGTAVNTGFTPDADQPAVAYVGNSRCVSGGRTGGGFGPKRYSRSGTTLTAEGTASADFESRIDMDLLGFDWDGSSRYRMGQVVTQGGASGTLIAAAQQGATNYLVRNNTIGSTGFNMGCNLNNTNKMLGYSDGGGLNLRAVSITWNSAANPTLTIGTANAGFNDKSVGAAIVSGHVADEAYIVYNGSSTTLDYRKVTVSGTTVTIGSKVTMLTGLSNFYYQISPSSAKVGTKTYLAGVAVRSSGAPYIFGYRLV